MRAAPTHWPGKSSDLRRTNALTGQWPGQPAEKCIPGTVRLLLWGQEIKRQDQNEMPASDWDKLPTRSRENMGREAGKAQKSRAVAVSEPGTGVGRDQSLRGDWLRLLVFLPCGSPVVSLPGFQHRKSYIRTHHLRNLNPESASCNQLVFKKYL